MTRKEAQKRAAELSQTLREWQRAYFVESRPLVSDAEYDRLFDELSAIEKQFPDLASADSPTQRVGSDLTQELPEVRPYHPGAEPRQVVHRRGALRVDRQDGAERRPRALLRLRGEDRRRLDGALLRGRACSRAR